MRYSMLDLQKSVVTTQQEIRNRVKDYLIHEGARELSGAEIDRVTQLVTPE